ncbi:WD40-repeat-containing domain protein [Pilobolus umbonatus]|nr:WD40-repeat-containing domain protein [Pilobolus umbonatus]
MYQLIKQREWGRLNPLKLERAELTRRSYSIELSRTKEIGYTQRGGVHSIKIEKIDERYLLSGSGDGRIHLFDLEQVSTDRYRYKPIATVSRENRHSYAVTSVSWYPFDNGMFITSSYDSTIKIWDTSSMIPAGEFDLECRVNCQAISPIATHNLIACAGFEPRVRLCDLNSGAFTHSLMGHSGSVLSCTWSTNQEYILYSGGLDGTVRVWDIRKASSCLMSLDQDNKIERGNLLTDTNRAHGKGVNGLTVTKDGMFLVSLGLDEKIRLWDTQTGLNTLVNYGSIWRNRYEFCLEPSVSSLDVWPPLLYVPSDDRQVLLFSLFEGTLVRKLRGAFGRVTCTEQRECYQELYSGSKGGEVMIWEPSLQDDDVDAIDESNMDAWSDSDGDERIDV